jgi:hypothetical protein
MKQSSLLHVVRYSAGLVVGKEELGQLYHFMSLERFGCTPKDTEICQQGIMKRCSSSHHLIERASDGVTSPA